MRPITGSLMTAIEYHNFTAADRPGDIEQRIFGISLRWRGRIVVIVDFRYIRKIRKWIGNRGRYDRQCRWQLTGGSAKRRIDNRLLTGNNIIRRAESNLTINDGSGVAGSLCGHAMRRDRRLGYKAQRKNNDRG